MLIAAAALALSGAALADPPVIQLAPEPRGLGVGLATGGVSGLTVAHRSDSQTVLAGVAGWKSSIQRMNLSGDLHYSYGQIAVEERAEIMLHLSAGAGGVLNLFQGYTEIGLRLPLAATLMPGPRPFDVYLEAAPALMLVPGTRFEIMWSTGARIYFG